MTLVAAAEHAGYVLGHKIHASAASRFIAELAAVVDGDGGTIVRRFV